MNNLNRILDPGELDRKIILQSYSDNQTSTGSVEATFSTLATVWAKVDYSGRSESEKDKADKETAFSTVFFTIRYRTDLDEKMRVSFESKTYDILGISELQRKRFTELKCELRE